MRAQPYLADPKNIKAWGDPMYAARCWLVAQISGNNKVVSRTTHAQVRLLHEELGFEKANILERFAIARIVHNWLAVAALDVRSCQTHYPGRERTNVEMSLSLAEKRLMGAIKTLAFCGNVPPPLSRPESERFKF